MSQWVREGLLHMHEEGRSSFVLSYPESPSVDANKKPRRRLGGVLGGVRSSYFFVLFILRQGSCSPGWSQSHSVDDNGLELLIPLAAFQAQGCHVHYQIQTYTRDISLDFVHARHTSANKATSSVPEESFNMVNNQTEGSSAVRRSSRSEDAWPVTVLVKTPKFPSTVLQGNL